MAVTWDSDSVRLYVNGVEVDSFVSVEPDYDSAREIMIGADFDDGLAHPWRGEIDDVRIYQAAISLDTIGELYQKGDPN